MLPVLISGAGPAGLTAAITLARYGIDVLLVERRPELSSLPRSTVVSIGVMELLRSWGLGDRAAALAPEGVEWLGWSCDTLAEAASGVRWATGYPTREQSALISPMAPACIAQDQLEPLLLEHLRSLPGARVEFGTELASFEQHPDGVRAVLRPAGDRGGAPRTLDASYLIAAEGAYSPSRSQLGIALDGRDDISTATAVLFRAPLWHLVGEHRYGAYDINHPEAGGLLLPAGRGDRWLFGRIHEDRPWDDQLDRVARLIGLAIGDASIQPRIERIQRFSFAAQVATRFGAGRAFLVGDAAHRVTPRGGTGMNTAMLSARDLGWKLAWVLRGWAGPTLLDTYESERRPVAEHNVARSSSSEAAGLGVETALDVDLGGRIRHVWLPANGNGRRSSTLDLLGPGLTLLTGPARGAWEIAAARVREAPPPAVRSLDAITARALGIAGDRALLVRPDGVPTASWSRSAGAERSLYLATSQMTTKSTEENE